MVTMNWTDSLNRTSKEQIQNSKNDRKATTKKRVRKGTLK